MDSAPAPRLCKLSRIDATQKFGFHLTGQKNKPGQCHISSVEDDSPAHYGGVQVGDKVVEVDGVSVGLENHQQVVARIAGAGNFLTLLVMDVKCEEFHRSRGIVVTSALPHVIEIRNSNVGDDIHKTIVTVNCDNNVNCEAEHGDKDSVIDENNNNNDDEVPYMDKDVDPNKHFHLNIPILSDIHQEERKDDNKQSNVINDNNDNDILVNLAKTAKEMREIIMGRKKKDPRREKRRDIRRRVEMIEEL